LRSPTEKRHAVISVSRSRTPKALIPSGEDRVLIVHDSDVAKIEGLDEGLHNFVVWDRAVSFPWRWCRY
jgi:hypothetical protein